MTAIRAAAFVATAALTAFGLACDRPLEIPPTPTPVSLAGLAVVELAADVWLTDVFGDQGVGTGQDGELYLVNVKTGETRQLTNDGHWKRAGPSSPPTTSRGRMNAGRSYCPATSFRPVSLTTYSCST